MTHRTFARKQKGIDYPCNNAPIKPGEYCQNCGWQNETNKPAQFAPQPEKEKP